MVVNFGQVVKGAVGAGPPGRVFACTSIYVSWEGLVPGTFTRSGSGRAPGVWVGLREDSGPSCLDSTLSKGAKDGAPERLWLSGGE